MPLAQLDAGVARYNPLEWAVDAGRGALQSSPGSATIWFNPALLAALVTVMTWLATREFRAYQRSV